MSSLISIITPNYNASKFIEETIKSIVNQTHQNWELIIVDDCSTDKSVSIIKKYLKVDKRIKLIQLNINSGAAITRNKAIENANGNYIAFLDSDDRWMPNKLEKQLNFMIDNDIAISHTSYFSVDENKNNQKLLRAKNKVSYKDLLTNNYVGCLTAMYSVMHLGKVYMPLIAKRQDWALWLKITKKNVVIYGIDEPLSIYTRREFSVSSNKIKLLKYNWMVFRNIENLNLLKSIYYISILFIKKILK